MSLAPPPPPPGPPSPATSAPDTGAAGLVKAALLAALTTRLLGELKRFRQANANVSDPTVSDQLLQEHATNNATIIAEEVDKYVRSARIKPNMMNVQASTVDTAGTQTYQIGPQGDRPLKTDSSLTIGAMN